MLSYLQQCASMHALHKTLFSDVKRQTRWGQVTLLSHLIIKSWPLQHISLQHLAAGWKGVTPGSRPGQYLYPPRTTNEMKTEMFPAFCWLLCSCAQLLLDVCKLTFSWQSGDNESYSTLSSGQFRTWCPGRATGHCLPVRAFVAAGSSGYK